MKFADFQITNFKGIENIKLTLDRSPEANIYTLVGLNESGKTTILEAINLFNPKDKGLSALEIPGSTIKDYNSLIPISKRDNFNGTISIVVTLKLDEDDLQKINEFTSKNTEFKSIQPITSLVYYRHYKYKDSVFEKLDSRWTGLHGMLKTGRKFIPIKGEGEYSTTNAKLAAFCTSLIPSILYFPNFLFDFPAKILLETKDEPNEKEKFYIELVQDILSSLENETNIKTHLVDRIKSGDRSQIKNLDRLIQLMSRKITEVVFEAWNRIFRRKITGTRVIIKYDIDDQGLAYLEFEIEAEDGIYQINERSLGFKWFFIFLLFTQFRPFRKSSPKNIIFLFDEPASNLHSSAQKQLLKSFENLMGQSKIIYTTHSHHLINPHWLESTYVVKNDGLHLENPETYNIKKTNISIQSYREFVSNHPHNTAYFQPILDVLEYAPSNLELIKSCIFVEGKNDFYTLAYFTQITDGSYETLNLAPSTGSGNIETLISLYIGWAKEFIVLLDSDNEGQKQKKRYLNSFGKIAEDRIVTFIDIDSTWDNFTTEKLFVNDDALNFQKKFYPNVSEYSKTHFNRAIQEALINKIPYTFSSETINKFKIVLDFLIEKLNSR